MTEETLKKATELKRDIKWAEDVLDHLKNCKYTVLTFTNASICGGKTCPDWLKEVLETAIREHKRELERELKKL